MLWAQAAGHFKKRGDDRFQSIVFTCRESDSIGGQICETIPDLQPTLHGRRHSGLAALRESGSSLHQLRRVMLKMDMTDLVSKNKRNLNIGHPFDQTACKNNHVWQLIMRVDGGCIDRSIGVHEEIDRLLEFQSGSDSTQKAEEPRGHHFRDLKICCKDSVAN